MDSRVSIDSEALLEQVSWVRALARRLVRDEAQAEDVTQDALVVALRGVERRPRALRPWLGAVVRNLSRAARRRESRRARTEAPLGEEPAAPSTLELLERAATHRALVGCLTELEEPYRSVLLVRYFEGLSNEEIARRQGIPASTVATRLARAHERLRARWLAQQGGDRRRGLAALAALARDPVACPPIAAASGASPGFTGALLAAGLAGAAVGAAWWAIPSPAREPEPLAARSEAAVLGQLHPSQAPLPPVAAPGDLAALTTFLREVRRTLEAEQAPSLPSCAAPAGQPVELRGRVLDLEGRPVADLEVCRVAPFVSLPDESIAWRGAPTEDRATSDASGRFTVNAPALGWFAATSPGWTTVLSSHLLPLEGSESLLVVARSRPLAGRVTDERGAPIAGASLSIEVASQRLLALGPVLDVVDPIPRTLVADESGAFALDDAPRGDVLVIARKEGFELRIVALEDTGGEPEGPAPLHVVLERSSLPTVTGIVVDASGAPVEGALVSAGQGIATSDASGAFLVTFDPEHQHGSAAVPELVEVRAALAGVGSARHEVTLPPAGSAPVSVRLVLTGGALAIEGRVTDRQGLPVPSLEVFVLEDTPFGWEPADAAGSLGLRFRSLESVLGAHPVRTSADGSFRIAGLADREYRLQVLHPTRLSGTISAPVRAESRGVHLCFDPEDLGPIAGRVLDREGRPVPGVEVSVSCRLWWAGPADLYSALAIGERCVTDARGRFGLERVARERIFLRLEGEAIVPEIFCSLEAEPDRAALELVVARRCHLQLEWGDWEERADWLHLEAQDGSALGFMDLRGSGVTPLERVPVETGLSATFAIPDCATHIVLTRAGLEVNRVDLHPVPGELERVRL